MMYFKVVIFLNIITQIISSLVKHNNFEIEILLTYKFIYFILLCYNYNVGTIIIKKYNLSSLRVNL